MDNEQNPNENQNENQNAGQNGTPFNDNVYGDTSRQPQTGYSYGGGYAANDTPNGNGMAPLGNGLAIASLVLGILSLLLCCCYGIGGMIFGIPAVILGIVQIVKCNRANAKVGFGMAVGGIVLGAVGFILGLIILIGIVALFSDPAFMEELTQALEEAGFEIEEF